MAPWVGRVWMDTKDLRPVGPAARRSTRPLWPGVTSEGPSYRPVNGGESHRRLFYAQTDATHADAYQTWTLSPRGAEVPAV